MNMNKRGLLAKIMLKIYKFEIQWKEIKILIHGIATRFKV